MTSTNTTSTEQAQTRRSRIARAAIATALAGVALVALPATSSAGQYGKYKFGAKLNKNVQPSNSVPSHTCQFELGVNKCTWLMHSAYGSNEPDPKKKGVIKKLKIIAGEPGKFRPVLSKVKYMPDEHHKLKYVGPTLHHQGQQGYGGPGYRVEKYKVHIPVKKNMRLGIRTKETSMLRCSNGGNNTALYANPWPKNAFWQAPDATDGCYLLMQAKVKYRK